MVTIAGPESLILLVAVLYFLAGAFCWTLPLSPPPRASADSNPLHAVADAERAVGSTIAQLREGLAYIRTNRAISWSLIYLGIASSLIGVLGVLGPDFAEETLGLQPKDFVVVVLPLGAGIVMGILLLNTYGKYLPRRRVIEGGLVLLGAMLAILSVAGPLSRFLQQADRSSELIDLSAITSLLAVVVLIAFIAGIAYAVVAIPAQTQLAEDLPEDVRGRVFGVLNMLISISSFLPIIIVGPISDLIGTTTVIFLVAIFIGASGIASMIRRGPLRRSEWEATAASMVGVAVEPVGVMTGTDPTAYERDPDGDREPEPTAREAADRAAPDPAAPDPAAQAAADPFGVAPDDPAAIARDQAADETVRLPLPAENEDDRRGD
jgi:DHA3 family macrolide efflux protein-like MFS transporter